MQGLDELLAKSKQLARIPHLSASNVKRGVPQLHESCRLLSNQLSEADSTLLSTEHEAIRLLTQKNDFHQEKIHNLSALKTGIRQEKWEPTDLESFVSYHQDLIVQTTIEETRRNIEQDSYLLMRKWQERDWAQMEQELLMSLGHVLPSQELLITNQPMGLSDSSHSELLLLKDLCEIIKQSQSTNNLCEKMFQAVSSHLESTGSVSAFSSSSSSLLRMDRQDLITFRSILQLLSWIRSEGLEEVEEGVMRFSLLPFQTLPPPSPHFATSSSSFTPSSSSSSSSSTSDPVILNTTSTGFYPSKSPLYEPLIDSKVQLNNTSRLYLEWVLLEMRSQQIQDLFSRGRFARNPQEVDPQALIIQGWVAHLSSHHQHNDTCHVSFDSSQPTLLTPIGVAGGFIPRWAFLYYSLRMGCPHVGLDEVKAWYLSSQQVTLSRDPREYSLSSSFSSSSSSSSFGGDISVSNEFNLARSFYHVFVYLCEGDRDVRNRLVSEDEVKDAWNYLLQYLNSITDTDSQQPQDRCPYLMHLLFLLTFQEPVEFTLAETVEDFLWFRLWFSSQPVRFPFFRKEDIYFSGLSELIDEAGHEKYFDPEGQRPLKFAFILMCAQRFGEAIEYLRIQGRTTAASLLAVPLLHSGLLLPHTSLTCRVIPETSSDGPRKLLETPRKKGGNKGRLGSRSDLSDLELPSTSPAALLFEFVSELLRSHSERESWVVDASLSILFSLHSQWESPFFAVLSSPSSQSLPPDSTLTTYFNVDWLKIEIDQSNQSFSNCLTMYLEKLSIQKLISTIDRRNGSLFKLFPSLTSSLTSSLSTSSTSQDQEEEEEGLVISLEDILNEIAQKKLDSHDSMQAFLYFQSAGNYLKAIEVLLDEFSRELSNNFRTLLQTSSSSSSSSSASSSSSLILMANNNNNKTDRFGRQFNREWSNEARNFVQMHLQGVFSEDVRRSIDASPKASQLHQNFELLCQMDRVLSLSLNATTTSPTISFPSTASSSSLNSVDSFEYFLKSSLPLATHRLSEDHLQLPLNHLIYPTKDEHFLRPFSYLLAWKLLELKSPSVIVVDGRSGNARAQEEKREQLTLRFFWALEPLTKFIEDKSILQQLMK